MKDVTMLEPCWTYQTTRLFLYMCEARDKEKENINSKTIRYLVRKEENSVLNSLIEGDKKKRKGKVHTLYPLK